MHDNRYLYGTDEVPEIPADIIMRRLELLGEQLEELQEIHYKERDLERVRAVEKAIEFWESMREL